MKRFESDFEKINYDYTLNLIILNTLESAKYF